MYYFLQVDSIYTSAFFNFIAYMLYQISKSCDINVSLDDPAVLDLFLRLLEVYAIPKLPEVKVI